MKYQKEYDEIREKHEKDVRESKIKRLDQLMGESEHLAINGYKSLFEQATDEIKQLEEELKDE